MPHPLPQLAVLPTTRPCAADLNLRLDPSGQCRGWIVVSVVLQPGTASRAFRGTLPWGTGIVGVNMYDDWGMTSLVPVFQYTHEFSVGAGAGKGGPQLRPGDVLLEVRRQAHVSRAPRVGSGWVHHVCALSVRGWGRGVEVGVALGMSLGVGLARVRVRVWVCGCV